MSKFIFYRIDLINLFLIILESYYKLCTMIRTYNVLYFRINLFLIILVHCRILVHCILVATSTYTIVGSST